MKQFLTNMRPENFEDVIAAISLYRPGPMESIPRYIQGKHDPSSVRYETPLLKPILDVTYGCMVYQEQVMQIVRDLAGYSYGRSDLVRRAMAKKKHDVMAKEKEIFIHGQVENGQVVVPGAVRNGVPEDVAKQIFDEMTAFASYAFNKSHAAAYALVAVQTAWLKLHYPVQFMAALMNSVAGNSDKVSFYIQTCKKRGIRVLPPDVNKSQEKFSVEEGAIRFGFAGVKNLGHGAIQAIVAERAAGGPYRDIFDFCERVACAAVNKKCVESLIRAGAMDALPGNRAQKLGVYERAIDAAGRRQKTAVQGQLSLFDAVEDVEIAPPPLPDLPEFSRQDQLRMEREVTGVYITGHPLDEYEAELSKLEVNSQVLQSLSEEADGANLAFVGDGINDAPVLTRADVGIAMGAMGSDAAIEAADVVLMDDKPSNISRAIGLARRTMRIVWQNIVFALGVKLAVLVLAAVGIANMWLAVFADVGVAILAILNAMRCMNVKGLRK